MNKKTSTFKVVSKLWAMRKYSPKATYLMLSTQAAAAILGSVVVPIFVSQLMTHIANGTANFKNDFPLLISFAVIVFINTVVIVRFSVFLAYKIETKMQQQTAEKIFNNLMQKSLNYHSNRMSGGIVSDSSKLISAVERFWDVLTFNITPIIATIMTTCIVMGFMFWQYAIVLIVAAILIFLLIIKIQSSRTKYSEPVTKASSAMTAYLADTIGNISAVKAFAREEKEASKYHELNETWKQAIMVEMKYSLLSTGFFGLMTNILYIIAFASVIFATEYHIANIGVIYLVISYTVNVISRLWEVSQVFRNFPRIIGDATPMLNSLDEKIELIDSKKPIILSVKRGRIEFKKVNFKHRENKKYLFNNFNLKIKAGERIGLVGKSGAGKTTLTKILLRFSDINSGEILIDGQNIAKATQNNLRENIAFVPQEPILFHRSIRENIAYGKPDATDLEITEAAKKANALDFINDLPQKFDTIVGERGVKLSGGQRQRIAIARAILKNAPILVLDEATSALDSESEKLIQGALSELMTGRTSIVIAHRLSTIAKLDRIIVIDDGKIIEEGNHSSLLKNNGVYAQLWQHQSGGFIEE